MERGDRTGRLFRRGQEAADQTESGSTVVPAAVKEDKDTKQDWKSSQGHPVGQIRWALVLIQKALSMFLCTMHVAAATRCHTGTGKVVGGVV